MSEDIYTVKEVAELFKVSISSVVNWIKTGKLKAKEVGNQYQITVYDLKKFALDNKLNLESL